MLEEDGVLRCCLYVLVPSAAKKRGRDAMSAGHGGMPGPSWWEVGPVGRWPRRGGGRAQRCASPLQEVSFLISGPLGQGWAYGQLEAPAPSRGPSPQLQPSGPGRELTPTVALPRQAEGRVEGASLCLCQLPAPGLILGLPRAC